MSFGQHPLIRRSLVSLAAASVFASSLFGIASGVSAQDATPSASPAASPAASPVVVGTPVDTSGCWPSGTAITWESLTDGSSIMAQYPAAPQMVIDPSGHYTAVIHTTAGDITVQLLASNAPIAVNNFVCLSGQGFYDRTRFHRIIAGFVVQGGDPTGTGRGGPGYQFNDELPGDGLDYTAGTLAMANAGANTNGSQFFFTLADLTGQLPKNYTIFGTVIGGMDVLAALANTPVTTSPTGEASMPTQAVGIISVSVTKNP